MRPTFSLSILLCLPLILTGCGGPNPEKAPTKDTPTGAKVDLTGVSLTVSEIAIMPTDKAKHELHFNYTLENTSGSNIRFPCIYSNMDRLIEVNLTNSDQQPILLERNPLDELTLPEPSPRLIVIGKTTRAYKATLATNSLKANDPVNLRVRFHVPSRYDELRSTLEAPIVTATWPGETEPKKR